MSPLFFLYPFGFSREEKLWKWWVGPCEYNRSRKEWNSME